MRVMIESVPIIIPSMVLTVIGWFRNMAAVVTAVTSDSVLDCMTTGMGRVFRA